MNLDNTGSVLGAIAIIIASSIIYYQNYKQSKRSNEESKKTQKKVDEVQDNFKPNGGESIKDKLDSISESVKNYEGRFNRIEKRLEGFEDRIELIDNRVSDHLLSQDEMAAELMGVLREKMKEELEENKDDKMG